MFVKVIAYRCTLYQTTHVFDGRQDGEVRADSPQIIDSCLELKHVRQPPVVIVIRFTVFYADSASVYFSMLSSVYTGDGDVEPFSDVLHDPHGG